MAASREGNPHLDIPVSTPSPDPGRSVCVPLRAGRSIGVLTEL
ncbi:hypothetical protein SAMN05519104_0660 [Rhizobiales bacterium GAS188]|nr:hypothetical protein SAMN05519104_0660 [Rhizobiales bacterium GAS188]